MSLMSDQWPIWCWCVLSACSIPLPGDQESPEVPAELCYQSPFQLELNPGGKPGMVLPEVYLSGD